ncbi:gamma-glutamyltransferase [Acuticoccus sp.]|uniref:gamma-glutamyltransferase n=1 Tax=Acuticoccus sp. TaxID=1904378 RepID=UPI003B527960
MQTRTFFEGRSAAMAGGGMAATAHPAATLTAVDVLRSGGNAVDAALAAVAQLCVIEPHSTGVGGDAFVLLAKDGAPPIGLNGSGRAPAAATLDWYHDNGVTEIGRTSAHSVTVPGAVDAWCRLHADHGSRPLGELLGPAIRSAHEGYVVAPRVANDWGELAQKLAGDPITAEHYLPGGEAPRAGTRFRCPPLAATLEAIAADGRAGFYEGWVAEDIVNRLAALGGLHTLADLAENTVEYVEPISTRYRGYDILELPPNGQGLIALIILNVLSGYELAGMGEADRIHLLAEATKAAYADRDRYISDPAMVDIPVDALLSASHTDAIRAGIAMERAGRAQEARVPVPADTTYLCVVDKDRTAVSFINSLANGFGSAILAPGSGVMLQNRGAYFSLDPTHANAIAPRKRTMHTLMPGMVMQDGDWVMPFGVMGGHYQPTGHAEFLSRLLDDELDPQEALAWPRSFAFEGELQLEPTIAAGVAADLAARGHDVATAASPHGGGQAIWFDRERDVLIGGSDPRKDGCALGH